MLSKNHYAKMDPGGDCLSSKSARGNLESSGFDLDKDTLDLIDPKDTRRKSFNTASGDESPFIDEEIKLENEGIDQEWEKFLQDAKINPKNSEKKIKEKAKISEKEKIKYYRSLVTKNIMKITEKKQDAIAPNFYSQAVNEHQMINEKDIDHSTFKKNINEILNIEIILLVLSRKLLHINLTSDLEIARWKKFLMKFLKKNGKNHEGLFGMSQINFSIGNHEVAVEYCKKAIESSKEIVPQYVFWKAIYLYFIYLNFKLDNIKSRKVPAYFLSCESAAVEALRQQPENLTIEYLLLILSCEKYQLKKYHQSMSNSNLRSPSNYASKIMKVNKYIGYISWAEIYLRDK